MSDTKNNTAEKETQVNEPVNIETKQVEEAPKAKASETKPLVIKGIALALGAALLVYSFASCLDKIDKTNKAIIDGAKTTDVQPVNGDEPSYDAMPTDAPTDSGVDTSFDETPVDSSDIASDTDSSDISANTPAVSQNDTKTDTAKPSDKKNESKSPSTKEEIVKYFNASVNNIKPHAKAITIVNDESYQSGSINLASLGAFESMVNKLINSFMGPNKEKTGLTITSQADKVKYYPVEKENWASKLTAADLKDAKCTEKDGVYTIVLHLLDDELSDNPANGTGHHPKAFSVVKAGDINENAGPAKSLLSGLKTGYKNGEIICTIDAKTGNMLTARYDYTWILHVDSFGGVDAPFGGKQTYEFKW